MWKWLFDKETSNITTMIGYIVVVLGAYLAYSQWKEDQQWKRSEDVARRRQVILERIDSFYSTPGSRNAIKLLEGFDIDVPLYDKERPEDRYVRVTQYDVGRALIPSSFGDYSFYTKASAIRDSFDDFLARLAQMQFLFGNDKFTEGEKTYLVGIWIDKIGTQDASKKHMRNLRAYICSRNLKLVLALFKEFGKDIEPRCSAEIGQLKAEVEAGDWSKRTDLQ